MKLSVSFLRPAAGLLFGLSAVVYSKPAHAVMIVNATESGGNVIFNYSGSLNTSGLNYAYTGILSNVSLVNPSRPDPAYPTTPQGYFLGVGGSASPINYDGYNTSTSFLPYGTGAIFYNTSTNSGDIFGFGFGEVSLPESYASGTSLSGSATFTGESFSSLGMTTGTYVNTLSNNDTITLNVGTVPVPGPLPILGIPAVLLYSRNLKKRIKARREISSSALD